MSVRPPTSTDPLVLHGRLLIDPSRLPREGWVRIQAGRIEAIGEGPPPPGQNAHAGTAHHLICPAFIDAHMHLPQIDSIGCDGLPLLRWLDEVIFPAEMRWADVAFAEAQARNAYARMIGCGTLGYAGFATSHMHAWAAVVKAAHAWPLRGLVGQVRMDRNAPPPLLNHASARLAASERGRLTATVNPRFAISCTDELLAECGRLAGAARSPRAAQQAAVSNTGDDAHPSVHTHLSESLDECREVARLFPNDANYTAVYDRHGLLGPRTLLAHCLHLSDAEWRVLAERRCVVVHCPNANTFLQAGQFNLRAVREHGVRIALGSDVAAGPDLAMPRVARGMIETAKARQMAGDARAIVPTPAEAWRLITRGNAEALGWSDAGRLEVGSAADLLVLAPLEIDAHLVGRLIYTWRDDFIAHRVLNGRIL